MLSQWTATAFLQEGNVQFLQQLKPLVNSPRLPKPEQVIILIPAVTWNSPAVSFSCRRPLGQLDNTGLLYHTGVNPVCWEKPAGHTNTDTHFNSFKESKWTQKHEVVFTAKTGHLNVFCLHQSVSVWESRRRLNKMTEPAVAPCVEFNWHSVNNDTFYPHHCSLHQNVISWY